MEFGRGHLRCVRDMSWCGRADGVSVRECCGCAELEITVRHWSFSMHTAQMAEFSCVCADIMSRHSVEQ